MESEHWDNPRIEQNAYGVCNEPVLFSTEGLGCCIGVCIAWKSWAGILHSANISDDEGDVVAPLIACAKDVIPKSVVPFIRPTICGGDTLDDIGVSDDPDEFAKNVLKSRKRIVELLKKAGFGKPHVRWNEAGETTSLIADLKAGVVYIENDSAEAWKWPISQRPR